MKIPFFKPEISEETQKEVSQVLSSGWITMGERTTEFENKFAEYTHSKFAVMVNSCTAALHLCLDGLDIKPGDEIITTPYTFAATVEVIEYFDAVPVLVDVRNDNLNIDEQEILKKITNRTKAIIPVHFSGNPCEMDTIEAIAKQSSLYVIEDAAHCTPAYYKNRPVGSLSDATCFSFYANKCITTGEGGMITSDNESMIQKIKRQRLHGLSRDAANRYKSGANWEYDIQSKGYKYNPTDMAAVMGIGQLKKANDFHQRRIEIANSYAQLLGNSPNMLFIKPEIDNISSWHIFPIRLQNHLIEHRNAIIVELDKAGISTSVHFKPIHLHSYYREKYGYKPDDFPIANSAFRQEISLPIYPGLHDDQVMYICENLKKIINQF